jgi:hypothetical protein
MFWALRRSFWALPPWMAFLYYACPRAYGMLSRAQWSASPSQVKSPFDADDQHLPGRARRPSETVLGQLAGSGGEASLRLS